MIREKSSHAGAKHKDETPGIADGGAYHNSNLVFLSAFRQKVGEIIFNIFSFFS
jgi:hypothetical protein